MAKNTPVTLKYSFTKNDLNELYWTGYLMWDGTLTILIGLLLVITGVVVLIDWLFNYLEGSFNVVVFTFDWFFLFVYLVGITTFVVTSYLRYKKNYTEVIGKEHLLIIENDKLIFTDKKEENKRTLKKKEIVKITRLGNFTVFYFTSHIFPRVSIPNRFISEKERHALKSL